MMNSPITLLYIHSLYHTAMYKYVQLQTTEHLRSKRKYIRVFPSVTTNIIGPWHVTTWSLVYVKSRIGLYVLTFQNILKCASAGVRNIQRADEQCMYNNLFWR